MDGQPEGSGGKLEVDVCQPIAIMIPMNLDGYMTVIDFANEAGVSRQAVHKAMTDKRIKKWKKLGDRAVLIHKSELKVFRKKG